MKALLCAVLLALTSVASLDAATITYEHAFATSEETIYGGVPGEFSRDRFYLNQPSGIWTIPSFDFSLGVPEVLLIEAEGTLTLSGRIHDLGGAPSIDLFAVGSVGPLLPDGIAMIGAVGGYQFCTDRCDFFFEAPYFEDAFLFPVTPSDLPVTVHLGYMADTFATYEMSAAVIFRTSISGVARATYVYEPAVVPEPTTLLLLGSGLIGAEWKRRRRLNG